MGPGYLISNEFDRFGIRLPRGRAGIHLGVGSTCNWDIAAVRRSHALILLDRSADVLVAHYSLYRPLFQIADTASCFVAALCGFELPESGSSLHALFDRIANGESPSDEALEKTAIQFQSNVRQGVLDPESMRFALEVIRSRPGVHSSHPFRYIAGQASLTEQFLLAYDPRKFSRFTWLPSWLHQSMSFLASPAQYAVIRDLYRNSHIRWIEGEIPDPDIPAQVSRIAASFGIGLTDVYLSNVPSMLSAESGGSHQSLDNWLSEFRDAAQGHLYAYEVKGLKFPHRFATWEIKFASSR